MLEGDVPKVSKHAEAKRDGVMNPQIYSYTKTVKNVLLHNDYEPT